jgi:NADH-quinone oxidoreductase subunit M
VYGSLIALIKLDLKNLAAFSTLSHVSFVVLGIFTFTVLGLDGGVFQILNESLIGAAFFILLGLLYERYGTYDMRDYGGLATRYPWMVTMFVITSLAAVGLPMLNGFVGEFLILSGTMSSIVTHHILWTVIAATGVIFGATYMLWMIQRVFYGSNGVRTQEVKGWDLCAREHLELWPFAALFLIMGVASPLWMRAIDTYGAPTANTLATMSSDTPQTPSSRPERVARSGETPVLALSPHRQTPSQEVR